MIVQLCAEVACVDVCGHLPCVSVCAQESSDEFVETYRFGTRQIDRVVQRFGDCDVGQCLVAISRPQALRGLTDAQLFGRDDQNRDALASSFSLKLARGIAQTAGGDLRAAGDKVALVLPRRRS